MKNKSCKWKNVLQAKKRRKFSLVKRWRISLASEEQQWSPAGEDEAGHIGKEIAALSVPSYFVVYAIKFNLYSLISESTI